MKQNNPAIATVVNFGVSFLHLKVTENTEKPIEDVIPKAKPISEFFSVFSVTLRWRKETPKFTTVAIAGLFCFIVATIMILSKNQPFFATSYNSSMFSLHGTLVCLGLILYSIGSKAIPAAELTYYL